MKNEQAKRVLIVDDEDVIRRVMKRALAGLDFQVDVTEAENGKQALDILNDQAFDLVLLDIKMPVMDGLETLKVIRETNETKQLPVMMLTSENTVEDIYQGREYGATSYLTKPFDVDDVLSVIKTHFTGELYHAPVS